MALLGFFKKIKVNFRLKVFLTFAVVLLFFALISSFFFIEIQKDSLRQHVEEQGQLMARILAGNVQVSLFFEDKSHMHQQLEVLMAVNDVMAVMVCDAKGKLFLTEVKSYPKQYANKDYFTKELILKQAAYLYSDHKNDDPDQSFFEFDEKVYLSIKSEEIEDLYFENDPAKVDDPKLLGYVHIILSKQSFEKSIRQIVKRNIVLVILFLVISLGASFVLTRDVVRPLQNLIFKIKDTGEPNNTQDDISLLDDTFSNLIDNLGQAFQTIQDLKDGLEDKVKKRTSELEQTLKELRDTQMQLVQSEKMSALGQLVAGVAHEINNTINFVSGALPPLSNRINELKGMIDANDANSDTRSISSSERYEQLMQSMEVLLDNIWEGARRTIKIVNDLKNFSRPDEDVFKPVDINNCLVSTLNLAYHEYKHRLEIIRDFTPDLIRVNGSQGQLNQVFMNILINAIHAQPDGGTIIIKTWDEQGQVHVLVRDHGTGIPKKMLSKIFDPFFTTKEVGKGSGLGLSISYGIIINHQGEIIARNVAEGGCEFEIILPGY